MKLSISNIAWSAEEDFEMYDFLKKVNFSGLEIAPTRIFQENPYEKLNEATEFSMRLKKTYQLEISSMQSICFGKNEAIFSSEEERKLISDYIKKSIDFAQSIGCKNLVFGSPKNRVIGENQNQIAIDFFKELGNYATSKDTILALEPNPEIYGTNFINTTNQAFDFVKQIDSDGLKVNFDFGTFLYNEEKLNDIEKNIQWINHIHISEPYLELIQKREIHEELINMLIKNEYTNYVSIEMKNLNSLESVKNTILYLKQLSDAS
ncbi:MAG TPA: sugar phosphate isomerase/epimerase family protein [Flavobacterium sp.]|uniref:sugar phosphate isomerase/epimerase family protein n=1 Tax=unclassified Flavobacterium TaxID=196869 RepID=UPI0025C1F9A6|nr:MULTISPECIES: sugar phosphate isomerase/epimerase family protein [unclassified Flavobacterium]HRE77845.1 sugar phosphate isomerase/epimerase family protein [Flavobacterium sp.]